MNKIEKFCNGEKNCFLLCKKIQEQIYKKGVTDFAWGHKERSLLKTVIDINLRKNKWDGKMKADKYILSINNAVVEMVANEIFRGYMEYMRQQERISREKHFEKHDPKKELERLMKERTVNKEGPEPVADFDEKIEQKNIDNKDIDKMIKSRLQMDEVYSRPKITEETRRELNLKDDDVEKVEKVVDKDETQFKTTLLTDKEEFELKEDIAKEPEELKELVKDLKNKKKYTQSICISIDSRDRNEDVYPDSNSYQIDFADTIKNVYSIELVSANIPKSEYNINSNNNVIYFSENEQNRQLKSGILPPAR